MNRLSFLPSHSLHPIFQSFDQLFSFIIQTQSTTTLIHPIFRRKLLSLFMDVHVDISIGLGDDIPNIHSTFIQQIHDSTRIKSQIKNQ